MSYSRRDSLDVTALPVYLTDNGLTFAHRSVRYFLGNYETRRQNGVLFVSDDGVRTVCHRSRHRRVARGTRSTAVMLGVVPSSESSRMG